MSYRQQDYIVVYQREILDIGHIYNYSNLTLYSLLTLLTYLKCYLDNYVHLLVHITGYHLRTYLKIWKNEFRKWLQTPYLPYSNFWKLNIPGSVSLITRFGLESYVKRSLKEIVSPTGKISPQICPFYQKRIICIGPKRKSFLLRYTIIISEMISFCNNL